MTVFFVDFFLRISYLSFQKTEKLLEDRFRGYVERAQNMAQVAFCLFFIDVNHLEFVLKAVCSSNIFRGVL